MKNKKEKQVQVVYKWKNKWNTLGLCIKPIIHKTRKKEESVGFGFF